MLRYMCMYVAASPLFCRLPTGTQALDEEQPLMLHCSKALPT